MTLTTEKRARPAGTRMALAGAAACLVLFPPAPGAAQQWTAEARMGRLEFPLAPSEIPSATSLAMGLGYLERDRRFHVTAGVPLGEEDPLWGALDGRERFTIETGSVTLGLEAASQGFVQRYTSTLEGPGGPLTSPTLTKEVSYGWGIAAQTLPFAGVRAGAVSAEARVGGSLYRNGLGDQVASRAVGLGDIRVIAAPLSAVAFTAEARHFRAEDGNWTYTGMGALASLQGTDFWGTIGHWLDDAAASVPWSVGAATRLARRLELMAEGRQDALDPIYGSTPRRSWTAALRVRLTEPPAPAEPVPASYDGSTATIALLSDDAGSSPRIAGDFNGWKPEPMVRAGDRWLWSGRLEPGVYQYAFVDADGEWFVPESVAGRTDDGMGGYVALLIVEEPAS